MPQYVSFPETTDVHFLTLGEVLQVLFDKNGGDTEPVPACIYIRKGCPLATLPTEPARSGHAFTGWNTQADDSGQAFVAGTTVNANLTVYAQWQKIEVPSGSLTVSLTVTGDGARPGLWGAACCCAAACLAGALTYAAKRRNAVK